VDLQYRSSRNTVVLKMENEEFEKSVRGGYMKIFKKTWKFFLKKSRKNIRFLVKKSDVNINPTENLNSKGGKNREIKIISWEGLVIGVNKGILWLGPCKNKKILKRGFLGGWWKLWLWKISLCEKEE